MAEGWTYGDKRDDVLKQHPCLIPYEDLPELEKAYDRNTAIGTLKVIVKAGFEIAKK
jgi:ryanodine receptor 2